MLASVHNLILQNSSDKPVVWKLIVFNRFTPCASMRGCYPLNQPIGVRS